jgi:F-type H+-transporting ATPase subunit epsilon
LTVELVTPQKKLLEVQADEVTLSGALGQIGILPGHIALVTALRPGPMIIRHSGKNEVFAVAGGMAQVDHDKVTVLAEAAEPADEIDVERAQRELAEAQARMLEKSAYDQDFAETEAAVARAYTRITIAKG